MLDEKLNEVVKNLQSLPSIGKKSAIRLAYFLSKEHSLSLKLAHSIEELVRFVKPCVRCGNLSQNELCEFCASENRDKNLLCLVESAKDVVLIEESSSFKGLYFVLDELNEEKILKLRDMISANDTKELIFALTHSTLSDASYFFIEERLRDLNLSFSKIAQGIPSGVSLENVDLISLHKAISFRTKLD
ncbi:recombination protein RecR [uncultured Campylobacter sp.]|uniref:recombination protein RecR n=1 Tax=uncultured Campylobacter sp. TaxID=218934 RepID=UPI00263508C9|nr:recombination protein RecR [uncultured Campylobacter sp.]